MGEGAPASPVRRPSDGPARRRGRIPGPAAAITAAWGSVAVRSVWECGQDRLTRARAVILAESDGAGGRKRGRPQRRGAAAEIGAIGVAGAGTVAHRIAQVGVQNVFRLRGLKDLTSCDRVVDAAPDGSLKPSPLR